MAEFREKYVFEGTAIAKMGTPKALFVETDVGEFWVPKSQIDDDSDVHDSGHEGQLVVSEWWAKQKELV